SPEESIQVLDPLEIGYGHTAGIGENVGYTEHPVFVQDAVGGWSDRAVSSLGDDAGLDRRRIFAGNLVFERGRDQDVAINLEQCLSTDCIGVAKPGNRTGLSLVAKRGYRVQASPVESAAA